jgi:Flp pilus assembly protein TadG
MAMRRRLRREQEGQAMTEFAIVLPVLLLVILGIIQFGIVFNNYLTLTDAVRVGARQAAVSRTLPDPVGITTNRVERAAINLDTSKLTVTVTPFNPADGTATWAQGGDVSVKGTYPWSVSILGLVVMNGNLKSETTERVE